MKFIKSEARGPYVVYMSGVDGVEITAQIFQSGSVKSEKTCSTRQYADKWVNEQLNAMQTSQIQYK